ncbi:MAG: FG-GAP repeat protein, partial [Candidatus Binataceae bacterium]
MRARRLVYWIWLPVLVVIAGVAQPLWANAADDTRAALWTAVDTTLRRIQPAGAGHYIAESPANRLTFRFGPDAVAVTPTSKDGAWRWSLRLAGYGAPEAVCPVAPPSVRVGDHRIEYRRGAVTEWYDNRPEELEQGFTLAAPPAHGGNALILAMRVAGGLTPRLDPSAQVLSFHRADGKAVLRYGKVKVSDARGRSLPARLTLAGDAIEIQVNTRGAAWPVTVDPLVTGAPAEFTAMDVKPHDYFGCSVALAGDTALVGAAFVFTRSGKSWSHQAELPGTLADGAGLAVALSGDGNTALV